MGFSSHRRKAAGDGKQRLREKWAGALVYGLVESDPTLWFAKNISCRPTDVMGGRLAGEGFDGMSCTLEVSRNLDHAAGDSIVAPTTFSIVRWHEHQTPAAGRRTTHAHVQ